MKDNNMSVCKTMNVFYEWTVTLSLCKCRMHHMQSMGSFLDKAIIPTA